MQGGPRTCGGSLEETGKVSCGPLRNGKSKLASDDDPREAGLRAEEAFRDMVDTVEQCSRWLAKNSIARY
jgi:hypothetical protein